MPILARRILFYVFLGTFLVAAPLIVLYTAGYRYNFENGAIVRTGVLSVTTAPRNVAIALNGVDIGKSTPHVIKYLIPGTYDLDLEREGYHGWSGEVEVTTGITTYVQDVLLLRDSDPVLAFEKNVAQLTPNADDDTVAYIVRDGGWSEIWIYNIAREEHRMIDRFVISDTESITLSWSAEGGHLLAQNDLEDMVRVYDQTGDMVNIQDNALVNFLTVFWHPSEDALLYIATEEELRQYDLTNHALTTFDDADVETILIDASLITFVDNGTFIELRQIIGDEYAVLALLPRAAYRVIERDGNYFLLEDDRHTLYLVDLHATQPILLETTVEDYAWSADHDELVYTDGLEINVYNPKTHTFRFITRQGAAIEQVAWHPSGELIMVNTNDSLVAIEKQKHAAERVTTTLLRETTVNTFWVSRDGRTIYFYGRLGEVSGLYALPITR